MREVSSRTQTVYNEGGLENSRQGDRGKENVKSLEKATVTLSRDIVDHPTKK